MHTELKTSVTEVSVERLEELFPLAEIFWKEGQLPGKFDPVVWANTWKKFIGSEIGVIFGIEKDHRLVGALGVLSYDDPNDGVLMATEMFWFIHPNHRGCGVALLDHFEEWALERGCKRVIMVHLEKVMPKVMDRFYRLRGYRPIETHYLKEI